MHMPVDLSLLFIILFTINIYVFMSKIYNELVWILDFKQLLFCLISISKINC